MKIISKHKDFYDYLQGVYGIDEMMVYDRRSKSTIVQPSEFPSETRTLHTFAICNKLYEVHEFKGKFYHTPEEILELNLKMKHDTTKKHELLQVERNRWTNKPVETLEDAEKYYTLGNGIKTNINKYFRTPVLIYHSWTTEYEYISEHGYKEHWAIPYLEKFKVGSWFPAEGIWQEIYAFISWLKDNPEISNKQTDLEKLQAHGFDKKVSFRHRKS